MTFPLAPDNWFNQKIRSGDGIFDRKSFEYTISACTQFRTALDIGAHVGTWALGMSKMFENVYAFEAWESNFEYLKDNTADTKNIEIFKYAIGDKMGDVRISPGDHNSGMSHITTDCDIMSGVVSMFKLDQMIGDHIPEEKMIDLIKIDVEGYELPVLQGATSIIEKHKPVIMVELSGHGDRYGYPDKAVQDYLLSLGYTLFGKTNKDYVYRM